MTYFYRCFGMITIFCMVSFSLDAFSFFPEASKCIMYDPFEALVGMSERQFFNEYGFSDTGKQFLETKLQGQQGKFYLKQVEPFYSAALECLKQKEGGCFAHGKITFSIIEGGENPSGTSFQKYLDVAALQALPENNGGLFQVASNLNALELNGTNKERIYTYIPLRTQGEICALSALPGIIDRMYLQSPINFLKNFNWQGSIAYIEGYFPSMPHLDSRFKNMSYEDILQTSSTLYVGVQKNVCVTSGLRNYGTQGFKAVPVTAVDQRITQVFTAALDPYNNGALTKTIGFENLARTLLHGAYKGTFDVAYEMGTKKIFLTLVGGGVFQNKYEWIAQAISTAFQDFSYKKKNSNGSVEVVLILYHISTHQKATTDWQKAEHILKQLVSQTGGTWSRYNTKGIKKIVQS